MKYKCPCCGFLTFNEELSGNYEICPVCYWEDDSIQNSNQDYAGGANYVCLSEAKKNFIKFGAVEKRFIKFVRPSEKNEKWG